MTAPIRLVLTMEIAVRGDVDAREWACALGRALSEIEPLCANVPVVTTKSAAPTDRAALRTAFDEADRSARDKIAAAGHVLAGNELGEQIVAKLTGSGEQPLCRCGHAHDRHDRIAEGEPRRGACVARGCKCGIYRATDKVANDGGRR